MSTIKIVIERNGGAVKSTVEVEEGQTIREIVGASAGVVLLNGGKADLNAVVHQGDVVEVLQLSKVQA